MKGFVTVLTAAMVLLGSIQLTTLRAGEKKGEKAAKTEKGKTVERKKDKGAKCEKDKTTQCYKKGKGAKCDKNLTELTLSGKIGKTEKKNKKGKTKTCYFLKDADGNKIILPACGKNKGKQKGKKAASVNLEEYVGKEVTIVGKGFQKTWLAEITKIDVAAKTSAK